MPAVTGWNAAVVLRKKARFQNASCILQQCVLAEGVCCALMEKENGYCRTSSAAASY